MSEASHRFRKAAVERVLQGPATTSGEHRRAAFDNTHVPAAAAALIEKVAKHAWKVTDEDVAAAKAAGLSEDAIFELTVGAAMGQATRQLDSALAAVDAAFNPTAQKESA
ncbi:MAG: hypothetical protein SFX73_29810 [Kofleriaceae bacterium]|nr:hypothetical protein [Kofleriaceae bacterium]